MMSDNYQHCKRMKVLAKLGFVNTAKIADTLQGGIYRVESLDFDQGSIFKIANRELHERKMAIVDDTIYSDIDEDILLEQSILKYLTQNEQCPDSIVKFIQFFKTRSDFYFEMEDGGSSLFDFIQQSHEMIKEGKIEISEWHKTVKVIFKQMVEAIEYIHSKNICHFDISLENFLINDVEIELEQFQRDHVNIKFMTDDIQTKLCDFGLAQIFTKSESMSNKFCGKRQYKSPEINVKKEKFDAKKNDIWCLGVCLWVMIFGGFPWDIAHETDDGFNCIMDGHLIPLLTHWKKLEYVNRDLIRLFEGFFQFEEDRISLEEIKKNPWLNRKR